MKHVWKRILFFFGIFVALASIWFFSPVRSGYTVSPETTVVVARDENGTINYARHINEQLSAGVTPENNAMVLLLQAIGPRPEGRLLQDEYYLALGAPRAPENGTYFTHWTKYAKNATLIKPIVNPMSDQESDERLKYCLSQPWDERDDPDVMNWLKSIEQPLQLVTQASKLKHFFSPYVAVGSTGERSLLYNMPIPQIQMLRSISITLIVRANWHIKRGDLAAAWDDIYAILALARLITRGHYIHMIVSNTITTRALATIPVLLSSDKIDNNLIAKWESDLKVLPEQLTSAEQYRQIERFTFLDLFINLADHHCDPRQSRTDYWTQQTKQSIDWNPGLKKAVRSMDELYDIYSLPNDLERLAGLAEFPSKRIATHADSDEGFFLKFRSPANKGSVILKDLMLALHLKISFAESGNVRVKQLLANVRLSFALERYRFEMRKYPESLDQLVPQYINVIPIDLFKNAPLIYRKRGAGYLLYSQGDDQQDNGGDPKLDLTVKMPWVPAKLRN